VIATNVDALVKAPAAVPNFPDNARLGLGGEASTMALGNLNYVALSSPLPSRSAGQEVQVLPAPALSSAVGAARDSAGAAGVFEIPDSMATNLAAPAGRATASTASTTSTGAARAKEAVPGSAAVSVRSANGPLDVFVVDGGLNVNRQPQKDRQQAGAQPAPAQ
jgi:hypothetical protein